MPVPDIPAAFECCENIGFAPALGLEELLNGRASKGLSDTGGRQLQHKDDQSPDAFARAIFAYFAYIAYVFDIASNELETAAYGGNEYYTATATSNTDAYGLSFTVTMTHMICVENGYMHWFQFSGEKGNTLYEDFESMLTSVRFPQPTSTEPSETKGNPSSTNIELTEARGNPFSQFNLGNVLVSLIVTVAVYSLPIIIYRYAIRKEPIEEKKAKKITIIYGICAFIAMPAIIFAIKGSGAAGGAILLWSWVNYRVLIGGKMKPVAYANADSETSVEGISEPNQADPLSQKDVEGLKPLNETTIRSGDAEVSVSNEDDFSVTKETVTASENPKIKYCRKCGYQLIENSDFCSKCGTPTAKE